MRAPLEICIVNVSRGARLVLSAACLMLASAGIAQDGTASKPAFSEAEIQRILSHGPWPANAPRDPTNRVSGKREAIELGTRLFFDERLSGRGDLSCASCHVPERNWTDNLRRGVGAAEHHRNTPTLVNLAGGHWYGFDGAADSLWSQSVRPILDRRELNASARHVAQVILSDAEMACRYGKVFGMQPSVGDDDSVLVNVGKALAAFQETINSGRTPFDHFREGLARGAAPSSLNYSDAAQRGLKTFIGKGGGTHCHAGANFTNGEFFATPLSRPAADGKSGAGREAGVRELMQSRFNLLSAYNDDASGVSAMRTRAAAAVPVPLGAVKVPTLRNLMLTSPYGSDGEIDSLAEVVRRHALADASRTSATNGTHGANGKTAKPVALTAAEQSDLVVFLESLSTFSNPWRPEEGGRCD